jgi:hypothetical protein
MAVRSAAKSQIDMPRSDGETTEIQLLDGRGQDWSHDIKPAAQRRWSQTKKLR